MKITHKFARRRAAGLLVPLVVGLVAAVVLPRFEARERRTWDTRFLRRGERPTSGSVALVAVDDRTAEYPPWEDDPQVTWGPHYAAAVRHLTDWGATVIGFDYLQRVSTEKMARRFGMEVPWDQQFAQTLNQTGNVVLIAIRSANEWKLPIDQLFWANGPENIGAANFVDGETVDHGVVRGFLPIWPSQPRVPSLAVRLVEKAKGAAARYETPEKITIGDATLPLHHDGTLLINYVGPPGTLPTFSLHAIAEGKKPEGFDFRGKVVLIGETFTGSTDRHLTPFSLGQQANNLDMHGVEVWGNAVATILDGRYLSATPLPVGRALVLLLALGTGILFLGSGLVRGGVACALVMLLWSGAAHWLFATRDYLLILYLPVALIPVNYSLITAYRFFSEEREKLRIKQMWGRYLNPSLVEHLLQNPEDQGLGGKHTEVTVLFSDIRGFTAMSERLRAEPQQIVRLLNDYLTEMTAIVIAHGGIVDKYVGDALMAVWGAPIPCADGPRRAVLAALEMRRTLAALNRRWQDTAEFRGLNIDIDIGIGINTGEAVSGNIGSPDKMDFTVIGDTVNVASRLETHTKSIGVPLLIGEETWRRLGPEFTTRPLPAAAVKGKGEPLPIYTVTGLAAEAPALAEPSVKPR